MNTIKVEYEGFHLSTLSYEKYKKLEVNGNIAYLFYIGRKLIFVANNTIEQYVDFDDRLGFINFIRKPFKGGF